MSSEKCTPTKLSSSPLQLHLWDRHVPRLDRGNAAEIKLRAERRAGEMLGQADKYKGRPAKKALHRERLSKLKDLGVTHIQSHRWQSIAALPKKDFEGYIREHKQGQREITTTGALKLVKAERKAGQSKIQTLVPHGSRSEAPGEGGFSTFFRP